MGDKERRKGVDRRSSTDRRRSLDTLSDEERRVVEATIKFLGERRSHVDRRIGLDRRSTPVADGPESKGHRANIFLRYLNFGLSQIYGSKL